MNYEPLLAWMQERHSIYEKRAAGQSKPWTNDAILQDYKFTNVFRQLDKVSQDLISALNSHVGYPDRDILFNIVLYRMFNVPAVYTDLTYGKRWMNHEDWLLSSATAVMDKRWAHQQQLFTGAYLMTGGGVKNKGRRKHKMALETIHEVWNDAATLAEAIRRRNSIEYATQAFTEYNMISGFVGYELATDLTYTTLLRKAEDRLTWANPGPGAVRGLNRLLDRPVRASMCKWLAIGHMQWLCKQIRKRWHPQGFIVDMRAIEHSLCEFDKYERVRLGQGTPRSRYNGKA